MTLPYGIDVSSYQGDINFTTLESQNDVKFIIIRAGISWGFTDPKFRRNWSLCPLPKAAYHVPYFGEDPARQMAHFLSIQPLKPTDRLVLDLEVDHGHSKAFITDRLLQMLYYIHEKTGRYPALYSRANWVDEHLYVEKLPANLDWWLATYLRRLPSPLFTPERSSPPLLPRGVTKWLIHQTGDRSKGSRVGAQSYYIDSNRWNGALADMYNWFAAEAQSEPEPPIVEKPLYKGIVKNDIAPDRLNVRDAPNGAIIDKLNAGTEVKIWEDAGDWVRIGAGRWVYESFIQRVVDTGEVAEGLLDIPLWNQRDPRWANLKMGDSGITLGEQGCLVSDTASCLSKILGRLITPLEYGIWLNNFNGYLRPTNRMYWQMPKYLYGVPLEIYKSFVYGTGWQDTVRAQLAKGLPVMGRVDMLPGAGYQQHWVTFRGEVNGTFWIHDPWYGITSALGARYDKVYHLSGYGWK